MKIAPSLYPKISPKTACSISGKNNCIFLKLDNFILIAYRDVEGMARLLDTAPIFFDADADSTVPDGPIGGQTVVTVRNEHVSYILTWYSLSIITAFLWHRRFIKKMPLM